MTAKKFKKEIKGFLSVLPITIFLFFLYMAVEWVNFNTILNSQTKFILDALVLIGDSFFLNAIAVFFFPILMFGEDHKISFLKSTSSNFLSSFTILPKVILSYFVLMLFTQFAFQISQNSPIPALVVLVFFIWAPYFVALEQFADQTIPEEDDDEVNQFDPFDEQMFIEKPKTLFSKKSSWHLGFMRSLEFTSKNTSLAISVVFILWLVKVIPELMVGLTLDVNSSFFAVMIQILASCVGALFVNMYIFTTIFRSIEPSQRSELYAILPEDLKSKQPNIVISSPNGIRISILCLLVIFTTAIWSEQKIQLRSFPQSLSFEVNEFSLKMNEVVIKIELSDPKGKFRWFDPSRFRFLAIDPTDKIKDKLNPEEKNQSAASPTPSPVLEGPFAPILKMLAEKLIPPSRVVVYDKDGKLIPDMQYSPREGPFKIIAAFPVTTAKNSKNTRLFEFSYVNPLGLKQVLLTFSEDGQNLIIGKKITP